MPRRPGRKRTSSFPAWTNVVHHLRAKPDWWIISQLARRMGFEGFDYESPEEVFNELCSMMVQKPLH